MKGILKTNRFYDTYIPFFSKSSILYLFKMKPKFLKVWHQSHILGCSIFRIIIYYALKPMYIIQSFSVILQRKFKSLNIEPAKTGSKNV